jgi:pimeloyl-ACP methyl ester carboxylesterase
MSHAACETVVLVHGLWMHGLVMWPLQRRLRAAGFDARTYSYSTVRCNLHDNARRLADSLRSLWRVPIHLVAHSMGGIVAVNAAALMPAGVIGRIVLIGTPFAETYSGRQLERLPAGRRLLGACMAQWLHEPRPFVDPVAFDIGVIAGTGRIGMGRFIAPALPEPNDGVVAVEETRVPGMRDHIVLPASHTAMLVSAAVARHVCEYLSRGAFTHAGGAPA